MLQTNSNNETKSKLDYIVCANGIARRSLETSPYNLRKYFTMKTEGLGRLNFFIVFDVFAKNTAIFVAQNRTHMNTINVQINIDSPTGRRLLREVEKHPKVAKVEQKQPEAITGKTYTHEEVFNECYDILSEYYETDVRKLL